MHKVAVYGTLKKGQGNHGLLSNAVYVGQTVLTGFKMYHLGGFPGVHHYPEETVAKISVEVYEVGDDTFERLDRLEGYSPEYPKDGLYDRVEVETIYGDAWIYTYNGDCGDDWLIQDGVWR